MKKLILALLGAALLSGGAVVAAEENPVSIVVNGEEIHFSGQQPVIQNDSVLIPFRALFESIGAYVDWIPESGTIVGSRDMNVIELWAEREYALVNGEERELAAPVRIFEDTAMLPLRSVMELLSARVDWQEAERRVVVETRQVGEHRVSVGSVHADYTDDAGRVLMRIAATYPIAEGAECEAMNVRAEQEAKDFLERARKSFGTMAEEAWDKTENPSEFTPYYVLRSFEVTYDRFGLFSYMESGSELHAGTFYTDAKNRRIADAEEISWDEIVNLNETETASVAPYSYYLYDGELFFFLNSENSVRFAGLELPELLFVPEECYKIDLNTGESRPWAQAPEEDEIGTIRTYTNPTPMAHDLGFEMAELKDQARNVPIERKVLDGTIGEIVYNRDSNSQYVTVRAAKGDFDPSGASDSEKLEEYLYRDTMIELRETQKHLYAVFTIEKDGELYSYSVSIEDKDGRYTAKQLAQEIASQF